MKQVKIVPKRPGVLDSEQKPIPARGVERVPNVHDIRLERGGDVEFLAVVADEKKRGEK